MSTTSSDSPAVSGNGNGNGKPAGVGAPSAAVSRLRRGCTICGRPFDAGAAPTLHPVPCHVRAFVGETFHVWRCPTCRTLHCLEIVDLDHYYAKYPFGKAKLTWPFKLFYRELLARLTQSGFSRESSLLDYGCGPGLFLRFLKRLGYRGCVGFDPYGSTANTADPAVLARGPFQFILCQDVVEHVEDPAALLTRLDGLLAPGGHILVGTPDAGSIDPARPQAFLNQLHAPYHLHILTRETLEDLGRRTGWEPVRFFDRGYHEVPWFGLNHRAADEYRLNADGTMDSLFDNVRLGRVLLSGKWWFYSFVGYWLSRHADMAVMFRKKG